MKSEIPAGASNTLDSILAEAGRRMSLHYILDEHGEPIACDLLTWGRWFETTNRTVYRDTRWGVTVSTVFLGLDHGFDPSGPPVLWESMVFGGPGDQDMDRYTSKLQAVAGHNQLCARVLRPPWKNVWGWCRYLWCAWRAAMARRLWYAGWVAGCEWWKGKAT